MMYTLRSGHRRTTRVFNLIAHVVVIVEFVVLQKLDTFELVR